MRIWPKIKGIHFNFTAQNTLEIRLGQIIMSKKKRELYTRTHLCTYQHKTLEKHRTQQL